MSILREKKLKGILLFLTWFLFLSVFFLMTFNLSSENLQTHFQSSMLLAFVGFLLLYAVKSVTMTIPNSVLYIAAGILFPAWLAILVTYTGLIVSLSVGYLIGKKLGDSKVYNLVAKRRQVAYLLDKYKDNLLFLCFIIRLFSIPFGFASFFFGAVRMPFLKYILMSLIGVTPVMIPVVFSGSTLTDPLSVEFLIPFGISCAVIFITFIIYKRKVMGEMIN